MIHALDAWLWRRGISDPTIRLVLRNEILLAAIFLLLGIVLYVVTVWLFWFGMGAALLVWSFWALSRFFLGQSLGEYSTAFLRVVIVRWLTRLLAIGVLLYVALVICRAPALALAGGLGAAVFCALCSYVGAVRHLKGGVK